MRHLRQETKDALSRFGPSPLLHLRAHNTQQQHATLQFMKEWAQDLLMRENELAQAGVGLEWEKEQNTQTREEIDIEALIREEFVKKVESLYMSQLDAMVDEDSLDEDRND